MSFTKIIPIIALIVITGLRLEGQNPDSVCCPVPVPVHITNVVPATCEECNGEATAETNGCSQYNSYEWSNGQNGQTATQLCAGETYTVTITDCFGCTGVNSVTIPNGGGKIPNVWAGVNPNIICVGECALWYAGAVNGTPPYTYEWSPNGKTTPTFYECGYQGNTEYEVTVTGADGCSNTTSALLIVSKPTKKITASICQGGSYTFNGEVLTQNATRYDTIPAVSGGCDTLITLSLYVTNSFTICVETLDVSCNNQQDGEATISDINGSFSNILWSTGDQDVLSVVGLSAGEYSVTVTDNSGCITKDTFQIDQPSPITIAVEVENVKCFGNSNGGAYVFADGGNGAYTIQWSNGNNDPFNTDLSIGSYTVTVIDENGCSASSSILITAPDSLQLTATTTPTACDGPGSGTIDLTVAGGNGPFTYSWNNGDISEDLNRLDYGTYTVTVTDENGCQAHKAFQVKEDGCEAWLTDNDELHVIIGQCGQYPTFEFTVEVISIDGKKVKEFHDEAPNGYFNGTFDLSDLNAGVYFIKITSAGGEVAYGTKIIKNGITKSQNHESNT